MSISTVDHASGISERLRVMAVAIALRIGVRACRRSAPAVGAVLSAGALPRAAARGRGDDVGAAPFVPTCACTSAARMLPPMPVPSNVSIAKPYCSINRFAAGDTKRTPCDAGVSWARAGMAAAARRGGRAGGGCGCGAADSAAFAATSLIGLGGSTGSGARRGLRRRIHSGRCLLGHLSADPSEFRPYFG